MSNWELLLLLTCLAGYLAAWWLAVSIVFRDRLIVLYWVLAAFSVPMLIVDSLSGFNRWNRIATVVFMVAWAALPLLIDVAWGIKQLRRRSRDHGPTSVEMK